MPFYIYLLIFFTFFLDIIFAAILKQNLIHLTLCILISLSSVTKLTNWQNGFILTFLSLQAFLFYSRFALDLGILLLIILLINKLRNFFINIYLVSFLALFLYFFAKLILIDYLIFYNFNFFNNFSAFLYNSIFLTLFLKFFTNILNKKRAAKFAAL